MRFFELFIENKNLIKQGLCLLEICQNTAGSTDLATDRHSHDGPSCTPSSHTCAISSAALLHYPRRQVWWTFIGTTVRRGPSFQNTLTLGIWVLGSLLWTSWRTCRTDRHKLRNPTLGQTSPSSFSSFSTLPPRTVTSTTDHHKLRRWSLLHFFAQNLRIELWTDFLQNKEKLI